MQIGWLAAFADVPEGRVEAALSFWGAVTDTAAGTPSGDRGQFVPLVRCGADPHLYVQKVHRAATAGGWHLDIFPDDFDGAARAAKALGASVVRGDPGLVTLTSPAGQPFCLVTWEGESRQAEPARWPGGYHSLLDQVGLDLPSAVYADESRFWTALTGWELRHTGAEFDSLSRSARVPLRLLLQRPGDTDGGPIRACRSGLRRCRGGAAVLSQARAYRLRGGNLVRGGVAPRDREEQVRIRRQAGAPGAPVIVSLGQAHGYRERR